LTSTVMHDILVISDRFCLQSFAY